MLRVREGEAETDTEEETVRLVEGEAVRLDCKEEERSPESVRLTVTDTEREGDTDPVRLTVVVAELEWQVVTEAVSLEDAAFVALALLTRLALLPGLALGESEEMDAVVT